MILISGGLGYLGGRIAKDMLDFGLQVRVGSSKTNPIIPKELSSCDVVLCDLTSKRTLKNACTGISTIIHLAAPNAQDCNDNPRMALLANGLGTLELLEAAIEKGVSKFIYISTAHIYGSPLEGRIHEFSLPRPVNNYSITHRLAEDYVLHANRRNNISTIIFRLTNGVGSPINKEANCWMLVVNDLCKQVVLNKEMRLYSSKLYQRDFIPISSVCAIVRRALEIDSFDGEILNISSNKALTLQALTDLIANRSKKILGFRPSIRFNQSKSHSSFQPLFISNNKLLKFGFVVETDITSEIDRLLLNCKKWFAQ